MEELVAQSAGLSIPTKIERFVLINAELGSKG